MKLIQFIQFHGEKSYNISDSSRFNDGQRKTREIIIPPDVEPQNEERRKKSRLPTQQNWLSHRLWFSIRNLVPHQE